MYHFAVHTGRSGMCDTQADRHWPACVSHTWPASACRVQREIWQWNTVYSTKHRNSAAAHARKVLLFSVKNELSLENYLSYQWTKFCENRGKLCPLSLTKEKNFVIPEVDRHACTLIKSVLAVNATVRAPFIREPTFQFWWRSVNKKAVLSQRPPRDAPNIWVKP